MRTFTLRSTFLYGVCQMRILFLIRADTDPEICFYVSVNYAVFGKKQAR
jgi:hypothetical protein